MAPLCVYACCGVGVFIFYALSPVTYDIDRLQPYIMNVSFFEIFYAYVDYRFIVLLSGSYPCYGDSRVRIVANYEICMLH